MSRWASQKCKRWCQRCTDPPSHLDALVGGGGARSRLKISRARGFTKFVGRTDEMATLETALEQARGGAGAVVGVVGEAGVGKSRLCHEFVER
jgi:AAA ATPase domain